MKIPNLTRYICGLFPTAISLVFMTTVTVRADYQSTVLGDNPLAYYALNPAVDGFITCPDLSGNGNNGTASNLASATGPSPYITNAAGFNGSAAVDLSSGSPGILDFSGPITMEAWVQSANTTQGPANIIAKGYESSVNSEITLRANAGNWFGASYDGNTHGASGGQQTTNWTYLVCTYDGTSWKLYVNSVLVQSNPDATGALNFSYPWRIGTGSGDFGSSRYFNGKISQVALYTYGLSSDQVLAHYFVGEIGVAPSNAVALITVQPQSQSSFAGGTVTFSVDYLTVFSTTNQWYKNSNPISGQTNESLTLTNVQSGDATNYSVRVGNINGTTNSAVASLTLLAAGNSLRWSASGNTGVWDAGTSANWINVANSQQVVFNTGDLVLFDDTVGVPTTVSLSGAVSPNVTTVNSSVNNFTINGSGTMSGPGSLVKNGSSTLEIAGANDFTGPVTIKGGTVKMDEPLSGTATSLGAGNGAPIVVTNGATLAVNATGGYPQGNSGLSTRPLVIAGAGIGGNGALRSVGNDIYHDGSPQGGLFRSLTLVGNATIGSSGRWDLGQPGLLTTISSGGSNYNLTCLQGGYSEWYEVTIDPNLGDIDYILASGSDWSVKGMGSSLGNPTNTLTLHSGVNMSIWHGNNGDDNGYAKIIHVQTGAQFSYRPGGGAGNYYLAASVQLDNSAGLNFFNGDSGVTIGGPVKFNGVVHLSIGDSPVAFTNVISGPGGFVWDNYNNVVTFSASNTYAGPTVIGNDRTLALSDNGAISQSSLIFFGGNNAGSTRLDVSGRPDQTLTLISGKTLGGVGAINGSLVVSSGATLSPAGTNTLIGITSGANTVGTIAASGNITLSGTTIIKLNGSGNNDALIAAGGSIAYGGTLNLVNASASPLAAGDTFQIFNAGTISSSFANITPATPGAGLAWDTSQLNTGVISVVVGASSPVINSTIISGSNLIFSGTGGTAGNNYYVLTSTNVATPLNSWTPVATNTFGPGGVFSVTNAFSPATPKRFYLLKLP